MTVERDIARFALPFAAGAALFTYIPHSFTIHPATVYPVIAVFTALLIHPVHKKMSNRTLWCLIIALGLTCGMLSVLTSGFICPRVVGPRAGLLENAGLFKGMLKGHIDSIPFHDRSSNALISALVTGDKSMLPQKTTDAFRASGAAHILALSGLHLGIIYGILKSLLSIGGHKFFTRAVQSLLIVVSCGFYTLATGAGPSIVRAFLFILLGESASLSGRLRNTGSILWSALLIQLIFNPLSVRSVSFQLSYAAMVGIAYIFPYLRNFWPEENEGYARKGLKWIWNSAALSIACQITTAPVAWIYFGTLPSYFILTNLISLPLTSLIIPTSLAIVLLNSINLCPPLCIRAIELLIKVLTSSLETIASL